MTAELATTIERRILMETVKLHDHPEKRTDAQTYCSGYLRALRDAEVTTMDQDDAWYSWMLDTIDHFILRRQLDDLPPAPSMERS